MTPIPTLRNPPFCPLCEERVDVYNYGRVTNAATCRYCANQRHDPLDIIRMSTFLAHAPRTHKERHLGLIWWTPPRANPPHETQRMLSDLDINHSHHDTQQ